MSIALWCAPDVFMAQVRDDIIVLDVGADQYHCLLDGARDIALGENGRLTVAEGEIASELLEAGFATGLAPALRRTGPTSAEREMIPPPGGSPLSVLSAGLDLARGTLGFRGRSLRRLLHSGRPVDVAPRADAADLRDLLAAGRAALPWIPFEGECLQRAFQMRGLLRRHGVNPDWVFGVRTWPFAAHCWLQLGDMVVADRLERVRRYTPIMVG